LGLAQSLLHDPKVMILDEPTNGLDPAGIKEIRDHLKKLTKEKGMSVIVSSHLLSEMEMMCDRIAIIQQGKLIDIQQVHDYVKESKQKYFFELDWEQAEVLQSLTISYERVENGIEIDLEKGEVPDMIQFFVEKGIRIFEVKPMAKSLEDRFFEVTAQGEKVHA